MTSAEAIAILQRRALQIRALREVRRFEYRQRHLAAGVWHRVRLVLAMAERAQAIDEAEAQRLEALGLRAERAGLELEPPRHLYVVPRDVWAAGVAGREVALVWGPGLLAEPRLALLRFETAVGASEVLVAADSTRRRSPARVSRGPARGVLLGGTAPEARVRHPREHAGAEAQP